MKKRRSMLIAYLLWGFLGPLGIHRFYLGRPISGLIWFCTGGLAGIGWFVDLFLTYYMVREENLSDDYEVIRARRARAPYAAACGSER